MKVCLPLNGRKERRRRVFVLRGLTPPRELVSTPHDCGRRLGFFCAGWLAGRGGRSPSVSPRADGQGARSRAEPKRRSDPIRGGAGTGMQPLRGRRRRASHCAARREPRGGATSSRCSTRCWEGQEGPQRRQGGWAPRRSNQAGVSLRAVFNGLAMQNAGPREIAARCAALAGSRSSAHLKRVLEQGASEPEDWEEPPPGQTKTPVLNLAPTRLFPPGGEAKTCLVKGRYGQRRRRRRRKKEKE